MGKIMKKQMSLLLCLLLCLSLFPTFAFGEQVNAEPKTEEIDEAADLRDGSFASEGTEVAPVEVLGGKLKLTTVDLQRKWLQGNG